MAAVLNFVHRDAFVITRSFLQSILPDGIEVIQAQVNRVPTPKGPDYVIMNPVSRIPLSVPAVFYEDTSRTTPGGPGYRHSMQTAEYHLQLDVHGPNSADNTNIIATLFKTELATDAFNEHIQPLYCDQARQMAFINESEQYEDRWTMDLVYQINPIVTTSQDFARQVYVGLINVDTRYK